MSLFKTDLDCIQEVKETHNEEALRTLIGRHSGIYLDMIHRMMPANHDSAVKRELISEKDSFIYNCALTFDPNIKIKFSTYIGNQIRWKCMNIFNAHKRKKVEPLEQTYEIFDLPNIQESAEKNEILNVVEDVLETYPDNRAIKIFRLRYTDGKGNKVMPWKNIAKKLDMSVQGCINIHDKLILSIKQKYEQGNPQR